jgi:hypothetical protein
MILLGQTIKTKNFPSVDDVGFFERNVHLMVWYHTIYHTTNVKFDKYMVWYLSYILKYVCTIHTVRSV